MAKKLCTLHKTMHLFGFKIIDIWEDYLERIMMNDDISISDCNIDEKENNDGI